MVFMVIAFASHVSGAVLAFMFVVTATCIALIYVALQIDNPRKSKNEEYFDSLRRVDSNIDSPEKLCDYVEDNAVELYNDLKVKLLENDGIVTDLGDM